MRASNRSSAALENTLSTIEEVRADTGDKELYDLWLIRESEKLHVQNTGLDVSVEKGGGVNGRRFSRLSYYNKCHCRGAGATTTNPVEHLEHLES